MLESPTFKDKWLVLLRTGPFHYDRPRKLFSYPLLRSGCVWGGVGGGRGGWNGTAGRKNACRRLTFTL